MQDAQETKKEYIIQPECSAFRLHSEYQATGDQPEAIETLVKGFKEGNQFDTLLG